MLRHIEDLGGVEVSRGSLGPTGVLSNSEPRGNGSFLSTDTTDMTQAAHCLWEALGGWTTPCSGSHRR